MNNKDINAVLAALNESVFLLEEEYMENGGEVTESTEQQEQYIESLKALLEDTPPYLIYQLCTQGHLSASSPFHR